MRHHGVDPPTAHRLDAVVDAILASPDHSFVVATRDSTIIGMCALVYSYSTWSASRVCEVQDVVVTADSRGQSIGRGLIDTAERIAREDGCSRLFLSAESWNLEAHRFYRRLGLAEKTYIYFERALPEGLAHEGRHL